MRKISRSQFHGLLSQNIYRKFKAKNLATIENLAKRKGISVEFLDKVIQLYLLGGNGTAIDLAGTTKAELEALQASFDAIEQSVLEELLNSIDSPPGAS